MPQDLKRVDPPSRPVDGDAGGRIKNKNPLRVYRFANPNDEMCGVSALLELGYEVETHRKDGPRIAGRPSKEGDALMWRGQMLMSCPVEEELERYNAGQRRTELIDQQILRPGGVDGVRGVTGQLANNQTTAEVVHLT